MKLAPAGCSHSGLLSPESPVPDFSGFFYSTNSCMPAGGEAEKDLVCGGFLASRHFAGLEVRCEFLSATDTEEGSLLLLLTLSIFMVSACVE